MKKLTLSFVVGMFVLQSATASAQERESTDPQFSLTISFFLVGGNPHFHELRVVGKNISNEPFIEEGCYENRGVYTISVSRDGVPVKERDTETRKKREETARNSFCMGKRLALQPGATRERYLGMGWDYPMTEPGTYEVTVSRPSDAEHPDKAVTVKSNTITLVVPEPATQEEHAK